MTNYASLAQVNGGPDIGMIFAICLFALFMLVLASKGMGSK